MTALVVTTFVVEPFFSKPSDTLATSLLTIGVWFSLRELATQNGWLFVLVAVGLGALAASSAATVVLNSSAARDGDSDLARRISAALHAVLSRATPSRVITSTALVCLPLVVVPDERLTAFCLVSCAAINTMRPDVASRVGGFFRRRPTGLTLGTLEALRSDGRHLVRAFRRAPTVLSACIAAPTDEGRIVGLVTRTLRANDQDLFEFVEMPGEIVPQYLAGGGPKRNEVASPPIGVDIERDDVVGIVAPHTTISALRFQTFPSVTTLSAGDLVHTVVGDRTVVYQVTDATLVEERVSVLDRDTEIFVSARQIGFWSVEQERFDAHGWLPGINGIIRIRPSLPDNPARPDQITLGVLPGTDFSINVNFDDLITHHCAVLGVTGTGKSVFVRKFIRDLVAKGARCICVDLTGEYAKYFGQESKPLVNPETDEAIARCIAWLVKEEAEFANKRDRAGIAKCKSTITEHFKSSIKTFLDSDKRIAVMGVADLDSSSENVEYLRWFSTTLFGMAKSGEIDGRLSLVLEEAHTIVPETAFLTSQDGRTKGLVNSIAQIALQGRKYGIGLIVVAQRTANVSKTILTQCNTIIAFRQFDRTSFDFLGSLLGEDSAKVLPTLRARHAYISGKALTSSNPLIFQVPEIND
ncbi:DUF87 domain-containing protein [Brevundimonas sp. A19_0]|uniref:ATP-binding protein n=1 Tax=Brevundimonas sp. A19_0 TaxID=2821087 RepID=UPI001ADB27DA|nr:ATP-binding protein [Brevundimonas sp. A19_0]